MPENSTNRGYPLPVAGDDFGPQGSVNALGAAVDADVQALADDVADASGIDDGAIGPAKLDRAYVVPGDLATVATTGAYGDLSGTPTLGTAAATDASAYATAAQGALADSAVQPGDLATVATSGAYGDLSGTPTLGTAAEQNVEAFATSAQGAKADSAVQQAVVGNLLPPNVANGTEDGTTYGWASNANCTFESSTDRAFRGARSLKLTSTAASSFNVRSDSEPVVEAGQSYTVLTRIWVPAGGYSAALTVRFLDASNGIISTRSAIVTPGNDEWVLLMDTFIAPANVSKIRMFTGLSSAGSPPVGTVAYVDTSSIHMVDGEWSKPGVPVPSPGQRVKPTDASIVQLWNPAAADWVDAAASSSVVYGTTAGTAAEGNDARILAAIPDTTVDAKGDLLVGTADDTVGRLAVGTDGQVLTAASGETSGLEWTTPFSGDYDDLTDKRVEIGLACSDETTALTTGTAKVTFRMPYAMTLTAVRASVTTAPVGATLTVDVNESGSSVLSTKLTIDGGEKTSTTAATAAVISDSALADDAEITIDIDQVGSSTAGAGLKVWLIGTRA